MSELMTNARETYQDLSVAVSGPNYERDRRLILKQAFDLYLICEQQEKRIEELEKRRDVNPNCGGACRGDDHETDRDG